MQLPAENEGGNCWFAIRVSYSRELALKGVSSFLVGIRI